MSVSRRQFRRECKEAAVRRLGLGASTAEVARAEQSRVAELEREVGCQAMESDCLKRCVRNAEEQRRLRALTTRGWSTRTSRKK